MTFDSESAERIQFPARSRKHTGAGRVASYISRRIMQQVPFTSGSFAPYRTNCAPINLLALYKAIKRHLFDTLQSLLRASSSCRTSRDLRATFACGQPFVEANGLLCRNLPRLPTRGRFFTPTLSTLGDGFELKRRVPSSLISSGAIDFSSAWIVQKRIYHTAKWRGREFCASTYVCKMQRSSNYPHLCATVVMYFLLMYGYERTDSPFGEFCESRATLRPYERHCRLNG